MIGKAINRARRIDDAHVIDRAASSLRQSFKTAESYGSEWPSDAMRCYSEVKNYARQIRMRNESTRYAEFVLSSVAQMIEGAEARASEMFEAIKAKQATRIADWIAGTSNYAPSFECGTYARIKGANIETSRGASVPIEHACRLARVFDRIVNAGGKQWADGAGPHVGHYRVNSIGADGSLVIGCHEFNPDEARRLRDLLGQCAECQSEFASQEIAA